MNRVEQVFLNSLEAALRGASLEPQPELTEAEWAQMMTMAQSHHVLPMVFEAVFRLPGIENAPFFPSVKQQVRRQVMLQVLKTNEFLTLNRDLRAAGVRPLVVKGIICRNLYPNPDLRQSGDEDLLIPPEQFPACHAALAACGMEPADPGVDFEQAYEIPYGKPGSPLYLELHRYLFPPDSEAYGNLNRFFENAQVCEEVIQGEPILTLAPTEHLFYLICHAFKHFLHSGFGIRQVCDIIMFARHDGNRIDWERILENCRQIRAERFTAALLRIGQLYLGFNPEAACLPACWLDIQVDEKPMLEDLLNSGVFGDAELSRKHSSTITLTAVADQNRGRGKRSGILKSLFPSAGALEKRYPYLKKYPFLLPVAWGARIVHYGSEIRSSRNNTAAGAVKIGTRRVELLKQYGILDR